MPPLSNTWAANNKTVCLGNILKFQRLRFLALKAIFPQFMSFSKTDIGSLDLNLVNALVVIVEERSTTAAASRLGLAQSTVSGTLARLRDIFDDRLLVRDGQTMTPTARALEIVEACKPHIDALIAAVGENTPFDPLTAEQHFRLGCTDAVALSILPLLTQRLRVEAPLSNLSVRIGDYRVLPDMLATGEVQTVLAYLRDDLAPSTKIRVLKRTPWVVLRDSKQPKIYGVEDFCARTHVLVTPAGDLDGFVDEELARVGASRRVVLGLSSFALLQTTLLGTDLISTVPQFLAQAITKDGLLALDPCPVDVPSIKNTLAWRIVEDRNPAERWFRKLIAEVFKQA